MKPDEQRLAILGALGYEKIEVDYEQPDEKPGYAEGRDGYWRTPSHNKWLKQIETQHVQCIGRYFVHVATGQIYADFDGPDNGDNGRGKFDFLNDLNAMNEAEKKIPCKQQDVYTSTLLTVILAPAEVEYGPIRPSIKDARWWICHAPAAARAEAFLRTIGKWKD